MGPKTTLNGLRRDLKEKEGSTVRSFKFSRDSNYIRENVSIKVIGLRKIGTWDGYKIGLVVIGRTAVKPELRERPPNSL